MERGLPWDVARCMDEFFQWSQWSKQASGEMAPGLRNTEMQAAETARGTGSQTVSIILHTFALPIARPRTDPRVFRCVLGWMLCSCHLLPRSRANSTLFGFLWLASVVSKSCPSKRNGFWQCSKGSQSTLPATVQRVSWVRVVLPLQCVGFTISDIRHGAVHVLGRQPRFRLARSCSCVCVCALLSCMREGAHHPSLGGRRGCRGAPSNEALPCTLGKRTCIACAWAPSWAAGGALIFVHPSSHFMLRHSFVSDVERGRKPYP